MLNLIATIEDALRVFSIVGCWTLSLFVDFATGKKIGRICSIWIQGSRQTGEAGQEHGYTKVSTKESLRIRDQLFSFIAFASKPH